MHRALQKYPCIKNQIFTNNETKTLELALTFLHN